MNGFDKSDKELKELWGEIPGPIGELSEVDIPKDLGAKLKKISEYNPGSFRLILAPAALAILLVLSFYSGIFSEKYRQADNYANLDQEDSIEDPFYNVEGDEDIFDETLRGMEEIIWYV